MSRLFILAFCLVFTFSTATVADTAALSSSPSLQRTLPGIEVLKLRRFAELAGQDVGLITNHTGMDTDGVSTARLLFEAPNVRLKTLFSPEHGFTGQLDQEQIGDSRDGETGLRIFSLYGDSRQPTADMLQGLDILVFDIQDIGTRFYTYISTLGLAMQAASENGLRFMVLDRPNPINGIDVAGPVADEGRESFVAFHRLPVRHGMTVGELARMFRAERGLDLDLEVITMRNWSRQSQFDATGLLWVNPSPNMRNLKQALLYPGIGWLETTNLSVGRGTDTPFEWLGAPWIDGLALADRLNAAGIRGVRFVPVSFTPESSKFAGEACGGIYLLLTNRNEFMPVRTGLEIAVQLRSLYPDLWDNAAWDRLLVHARTLEALRAGQSAGEIESGWTADLEAFRQRRSEYLLYD